MRMIKKLVRAIIDSAEKSNNQRQHVSHAILSHIVPTVTELRLLRPKTNQKAAITKDYMDDLMSKSSAADVAVRKAFQLLCEKHGVPAKPGYV
jgi:hypothetical protein